MTPVAEQPHDRTLVHDRAFARTSPDGRIDGAGERGIYAGDLRLLRRVEVFRAEQEVGIGGTVAVGPDGCAVRFTIDAVEPGASVLLVAEVDGTDLFEVRTGLVDTPAAAASTGLGLGSARPDARVRFELDVDGAELTDRDGVALSLTPVQADGTARTASWRCTVAADETGPVDVRLELRVSWALATDSQPPVPSTFNALERDRRSAVEPWAADRPSPGGVDDVARVLRATVDDLAALRIRVDDGILLAAGVPWFLTVFGRDSLLSAWMALPVDPDLAVATLRHLARHQATAYDLATDAEPGKVQHEERTGVAAQRWHERYYGSVDATSLFVMLAAEHLRWTGDDSVVRDLEQSIRAAVGWILSRVDEDELGLIGFWRRGERGLEIQSWKDSPDSQRDHAGRVATGLIRPIEAQGYGVAALRGAARIATQVWKDEVVASEWAAAARLLERRLVERTLVELPPARLGGADDPRHGGYLAQGVDSAGHAIDSLCSNPGHLLWTESIADPSLRSRVAAQLSSDALDSGWGIRTMSTLDQGYDATSYHCGSVWPHDTAICIAGIARYDRESAARLARNLFDAAAANDGRLPEHFSGVPRAEDDRAPDAITTACSPQAWSAAAPLLVLRALLGLEPDANGNELVAAAGEAPSWLAGFRWRGVRALGAKWDIEVGRDLVVDVVRAV